MAGWALSLVIYNGKIVLIGANPYIIYHFNLNGTSLGEVTGPDGCIGARVFESKLLIWGYATLTQWSSEYGDQPVELIGRRIGDVVVNNATRTFMATTIDGHVQRWNAVSSSWDSGENPQLIALVVNETHLIAGGKQLMSYSRAPGDIFGTRTLVPTISSRIARLVTTGDMLIGGCLDGYLRIYDPNGLLVRTIAPPGQYADVTALLLMNQNIIAGYQQGNVLIWRSDGVLVNSYEICTAADTRVYDLVTDGTLIFILCSQSIAAVHTRTRQINYNFGPYSSFELRAMGIPSMLVALAT